MGHFTSPRKNQILKIFERGSRISKHTSFSNFLKLFWSNFNVKLECRNTADVKIVRNVIANNQKRSLGFEVRKASLEINNNQWLDHTIANSQLTLHNQLNSPTRVNIHSQTTIASSDCKSETISDCYGEEIHYKTSSEIRWNLFGRSVK